MIISYDASDWKKEYDNGNIRPTNVDDAIDLMRESDVKTSQLAVALIVGRETGEVKDETLPSNKMANLMGMSLHVSRYRSQQRAKVRLGKNQHETTVPRFVGTATTDKGEMVTYDATVEALRPDVTVVDYNTPEGAERARVYLMTNVIGRIRERLGIIAVNDPKQVAKVAAEMKAAIDDIVKELS